MNVIATEHRRREAAIAAAIGIGLFSIYALGASRTIYVGDSGELVTAVHVVGIPHPSGYPLYVLLGKLWTLLLPAGSIAFRMSLFSAACAAATCVVLYTTVRREGGSRIAGLFGAGILALGPSFWHEANIQRVYALNALFVAIALDRALAWHRDRKPRDLVVAMLVCGLGATNHTFMALVGVAIAVWAPIVEPSLVRRPKVVAASAAAFFVGLLPYLHLPLRSRMNPVMNWGEPRTLDAFLDVVLRRDFWHRAWWQSPADLGPILLDFGRSLGPETGYAGVALALIALVVRPDRKSILPLLVIAANVGAMARHGSFLDIFVWHRYYIPSYLAVALLAAAGLDAVGRRLPRRGLALALVVPIVMFATGWSANDRSRYSYSEDFARLVLDSVPPGAKLLTRDDNVLFTLLYLRYVEGLRPDVELIAEAVDQRKPDLVFNPDVDAVFFTHPPSWSVEGLELAPKGAVFQAIRTGRPFPPPDRLPPLAGLDDPSIPKDFLTRTLIAHYWLMRALAWERWDWTLAEEALRAAESVAPDSNFNLYNVALVWERNGFFDEALRLLDAADAIDPRGLVLGADPKSGEPMRILASGRASRLRAERARVMALEAELARSIGTESAPGSAAWHGRMSELLATRGEAAAARFHALRASPIGR